MKAGMIGLGAMGTHMARNLHKAALLHGLWNRTQAKADALATELKTVSAGSIRELAADCHGQVNHRSIISFVSRGSSSAGTS